MLDPTIALTNVDLKFWPPNCTSIMQPLDQGTIHAFKAIYRRLLLSYIVNLIEEQIDGGAEKPVRHVMFCLFGHFSSSAAFLFLFGPFPLSSLSVWFQVIPPIALLQAMRWCHEAWSSVSGETIRNCWLHSGACLIVTSMDCRS